MPGFFKPTPVTELLTNFLRQAFLDGETFLSYEDLNAAADTDVQIQPGYGYLLTARKRVQEDDAAVWECERGKGLYLMETTERCGVGKRTVKRVRRTVKKGKKVLETVDLGDCSESDLNKFNTSATIIVSTPTITIPVAAERSASQLTRS